MCSSREVSGGARNQGVHVGTLFSCCDLQANAHWLIMLRCMLHRNSFNGDDDAYWSYMTNKMYKKVGAPDVTMAYDAQGNLLQSGAPSTLCCQTIWCWSKCLGVGNRVFIRVGGMFLDMALEDM